MIRPASSTTTSEIGRPRDNTRSRVCPRLCIAPVADRVKLKESISCKNSPTNGLDGQQTCILKYPRKRKLSHIETKPDKNSSEDSVIKTLLYFGGLYIRAHNRDTESILNS